jgi:hypothetical protein
MNIKNMIMGGKKVTFVKYKKGELFYKTECDFEFPVAISDTGDGEFPSVDKASYYMRWINKQIKSINEGKSLEM